MGIVNIFGSIQFLFFLLLDDFFLADLFLFEIFVFFFFLFFFFKLFLCSRSYGAYNK